MALDVGRHCDLHMSMHLQTNIPPTIHPSIHPSIHTTIHPFSQLVSPLFIRSVRRSFSQSVVHSFMKYMSLPKSLMYSHACIPV